MANKKTTATVVAIAGMLYEEKPDEYVHQAKAPMSAHLTNLAPRDAV